MGLLTAPDFVIIHTAERMYEAFRYELDPNRAQRAALAKHVGAAGGLERCLEALERGDRIPNAVELHKA